MKQVKFIKDSQTRIVRYSFNGYEVVNGIKVFASAHAVKKGNKLIIANCFATNGNIISGEYKIISEGAGRIAEVICIKLLQPRAPAVSGAIFKPSK